MNDTKSFSHDLLGVLRRTALSWWGAFAMVSAATILLLVAQEAAEITLDLPGRYFVLAAGGLVACGMAIAIVFRCLFEPRRAWMHDFLYLVVAVGFLLETRTVLSTLFGGFAAGSIIADVLVSFTWLDSTPARKFRRFFAHDTGPRPNLGPDS